VDDVTSGETVVVCVVVVGKSKKLGKKFFSLTRAAVTFVVVVVDVVRCDVDRVLVDVVVDVVGGCGAKKKSDLLLDASS